MWFSRFILLTGATELYFSKMSVIFNDHYQGKKLSIIEYDCWKALETVSFADSELCADKARPPAEARVEPGLEFRFPGSRCVCVAVAPTLTCVLSMRHFRCGRWELLVLCRTVSTETVELGLNQSCFLSL